MRRILVAAVAAGLLLAGCGGSDGTSLSSIKVSGGTDDPSIKVGTDFKTTSTTTRVVDEGDGEKLAKGDSATINYLAVNGRTGKPFDNSFTSKNPVAVDLSDDSPVLKGLVKGLIGQKVGTRFLVAIPPKDAWGTANDALGLKADDTAVFLVDVISKTTPDPAAKPLPEATGKKADLPKDVPAIVLDKDGHPSGFKAGKDTPKSPKMSAHVVIEGDGAAITTGQSITAQYVGQVYPDGKVFDESWSKGSFKFSVGVGQVIACWDQQLVGQKVGSRVVMVCPAEVAYGDQGQGDIKPGDTLLFAVDLLAAS